MERHLDRVAKLDRVDLNVPKEAEVGLAEGRLGLAFQQGEHLVGLDEIGKHLEGLGVRGDPEGLVGLDVPHPEARVVHLDWIPWERIFL